MKFQISKNMKQEILISDVDDTRIVVDKKI